MPHLLPIVELAQLVQANYTKYQRLFSVHLELYCKHEHCITTHTISKIDVKNRRNIMKTVNLFALCNFKIVQLIQVIHLEACNEQEMTLNLHVVPCDKTRNC